MHRWHLLRPFLIARECPTCGNWSSFHIDRFREDAVMLKTLEHGHPAGDQDDTDALRAAGLLG